MVLQYIIHSDLVMKLELCLAICLTIVSCVIFQSQPQSKPHPKADIVYFNGPIITMNEKHKFASFVAVAAGKIIHVGKFHSHIHKFVAKNTTLINLHGKTIIPGFIDSHSHFSLTAIKLGQGFDLSPPPFGSVTSIAQIVENIKGYISQNNIPAGKIIYGLGYSDIDLIEHRHPSRYDLDAASTVNPICIRHFSNHILACNSLALAEVGYTDDTPNPPGGQIDHFPNGTLHGVTREWGMSPLLTSFATNFWNLTAEQIKDTIEQYASCGVTTVHDMLNSLIEPIVYHSLGDSLPIDVRGYFYVTSADLSIFEAAKEYQTSRFKVAGTKIILDGSIQGYTALLSRPYWVPQSIEFSDLSNYTYNTSRSCLTESCGVNDFPDPQIIKDLFLNFLEQRVDSIVHCNGDGAMDNMIEAVEWARNQMKIPSDARFVMLHTQTIREDQLDQLVRLHIIPSFFPGHLYYWGDKHYSIFLGPERANRMNPIRSAINRNLTFTLHLDSPTILTGKVQGINTFLQIIFSAVLRKTMKGRILGEDQRITVYEALKGLTINGAWQMREENRKGSLQVGKLADLLILSNNPLQVRPEMIVNISVLATVKEGALIYGSYPKKGMSYADQAENIQKIIDQEAIEHTQQFEEGCQTI